MQRGETPGVLSVERRLSRMGSGVLRVHILSDGWREPRRMSSKGRYRLGWNWEWGVGWSAAAGGESGYGAKWVVCLFSG